MDKVSDLFLFFLSWFWHMQRKPLEVSVTKVNQMIFSSIKRGKKDQKGLYKRSLKGTFG